MASDLHSVGVKALLGRLQVGSVLNFRCRSHIFWVDRKTPLWAVQVSAQPSGTVVQALGFELCHQCVLRCPQQPGQRVPLAEQKMSWGFCWEQPRTLGEDPGADRRGQAVGR